MNYSYPSWLNNRKVTMFRLRFSLFFLFLINFAACKYNYGENETYSR